MKFRRPLFFAFLYALAVSLAASGNAAPSPAPVVDGCLNQVVSNGVWRARVTKIEPVRRKTGFDDQPKTGWGVSMEWTNATKSTLNVTNNTAWNWGLSLPSGVGIGLRAYDDSAELSGKDTYASFTSAEDQTGLYELFYPHDRPNASDFPPGVTRKGEIKFWYPANYPGYGGKPTKLLIQGSSELVYLHRPPGFRFNLNCAK